MRPIFESVDMRKLVWFTLGFSAACAFAAYVYCGWNLFLAGIVFLMLALIAKLLCRSRIKVKILAAVCLGLSFGLIWTWVYDSVLLQDIKDLDGTEDWYTLSVSDYPKGTEGAVQIEAVFEHQDASIPVLVYLENCSAEPGDLLRGRFRLKLIDSGENQTILGYRGEGIRILAYSNSTVNVINDDPDTWRSVTAVFRKNLLNRIEAVFPDDVAPFAKALLLGYTDELTYKTDTDLKISGIRHVVAVSGLHVSVLLSVIFFAIGHRGLFALLFSLPLLLLFAAVTGFPPSIVRACIMQVLMLLAVVVKREYDPPTSLAVSVLVLLLYDPATILSAGFQLSVGSVLGIFLFSGKIQNKLKSLRWIGDCKGKGVVPRIKRYAVSSVSVSLGATIMTMPLCAVYFGTVSLISLLTNLLCLWLLTFIFTGILLACAVSFILPSVAVLMGAFLSLPIRGILWLASVFSDIPLAAVYTQSWSICIWLCVSYVLLFAYLYIPNLHRKLLLFLIPALLCCAITESWISPCLDSYRVTVLDVGQGQCVLLQSEGRTYMVDCGGYSDQAAADSAVAQLYSQGVTRLDGLVLTHYNKDHVGGVQYLLQRITVDNLYLPLTQDEYGYRFDILKAYGEMPIYIEKDTYINWQGTSLRLFSDTASEDANENSLCVLFQTKKCDILITGDRNEAGEKALLRNHWLPSVEVLIVGHHGSQYSTSEYFLQALGVETAIISVGEDNIYGHPAQSVLDRLEKFGCKIYRTDLDGTVVLRG